MMEERTLNLNGAERRLIRAFINFEKRRHSSWATCSLTPHIRSSHSSKRISTKCWIYRLLTVPNQSDTDFTWRFKKTLGTIHAIVTVSNKNLLPVMKLYIFILQRTLSDTKPTKHCLGFQRKWKRTLIISNKTRSLAVLLRFVCDLTLIFIKSINMKAARNRDAFHLIHKQHHAHRKRQIHLAVVH